MNGLQAVTTDDGAPTYMGAVSPWFFTHYSPQTYNKNVSLPGDGNLIVWLNVIDGWHL